MDYLPNIVKIPRFGQFLSRSHRKEFPWNFKFPETNYTIMNGSLITDYERIGSDNAD